MMVFDSTHFSVIREQFSLKEFNLAIKLSQMMGYQWKKDMNWKYCQDNYFRFDLQCKKVILIWYQGFFFFENQLNYIVCFTLFNGPDQSQKKSTF